jgi:hypothetical protein
MKYIPLKSVEETIAQGRFAIIEALDGRLVIIDSVKYTIINRCYRTCFGWKHLAALSDEVLVNLLKSSLIPVYVQQPENDKQRVAVDWILRYSAQQRMEKITTAYWQMLDSVHKKNKK